MKRPTITAEPATQGKIELVIESPGHPPIRVTLTAEQVWAAYERALAEGQTLLDETNLIGEASE